MYVKELIKQLQKIENQYLEVEMNTVIRDIMRDQVTETVLRFTDVMNKVQKALAQYL